MAVIMSNTKRDQCRPTTIIAIMLAVLVLCRSTNAFAPITKMNRDCLTAELLAFSSSRYEHVERKDRRRFLLSIFGAVTTGAMFPNEFAVAGENPEAKKPFASNEALLPAARVKLTIDRATQLAKELVVAKENETTANSIDSKGQQSSALQELEKILLPPQNYVGTLKLQGVPDKPAQQYLESYRPMSGDLPFQRYLIQTGDVRAWMALKRTEKEQERVNEIRAALNAYTDVLSFSGTSYQLNVVDKATKSKMVREDRLPALKQVITSDMGLRYLYRNQVITAMDDVRAELEYQLSRDNKGGTDAAVKIDARDLLELLTEAEQACDKWFSLIDPKDARLAMETVAMEGRGD